MFGIGFGELLIIIVVLIIAVGPDQLPSLMRTIGKTIRSMRQASQDLRDSIGIDEFMGQDLLNPRSRPNRRVKPEIPRPAKNAKQIEKDVATKPQESLPETVTATVNETDSDEIADQAAEISATQVDQGKKEESSGKTGEN